MDGEREGGRERDIGSEWGEGALRKVSIATESITHTDTHYIVDKMKEPFTTVAIWRRLRAQIGKHQLLCSGRWKKRWEYSDIVLK